MPAFFRLLFPSLSSLPLTHTILVVEDDQFLLEMIDAELREHGIRVEHARDGEEAIAALTVSQPQMMLLDLMLPKVDGFGVLDFCKTNGFTFPILTLSNLSDAWDVERARDLGAVSHLVKGSIDGDLWASIKEYL